MKVFLAWWSKRNFFVFTFLTVLLSSVILLPIGLISEVFFPQWFLNIENISSEKMLQHEGFLSAFFSICIIVPLIETLLFQLIPISLLGRVTNNKYIQITTSALLFGSTHYFNFIYFFSITLVGLVYATGYILGKDKRGKSFAFWSIATSHSISNIIAILPLLEKF